MVLFGRCSPELGDALWVVVGGWHGGGCPYWGAMLAAAAAQMGFCKSFEDVWGLHNTLAACLPPEM